MTGASKPRGTVKSIGGAVVAGPPQPDLPRLTRDKPLGWHLVITGVIGWLASGALVLEKLEALKDPGYQTVCDINPWISCGQVMQTWQSSVFGFPNMFIGVVAFAVIITTGMALLSGATFAPWYWAGLQTGVTLGFAFAVWLWSQLPRPFSSPSFTCSSARQASEKSNPAKRRCTAQAGDPPLSEAIRPKGGAGTAEVPGPAAYPFPFLPV